MIPYLDAGAARADPKPFLGYSDNTNLLNWLFVHGVSGFYGGSTQVQLGPGPAVDPVHGASLRAALLTGGRLEVTEPGRSEDMGWDWNDPRALTEYGVREPTEPWSWAGPRRVVTGPSWGGCIDVLQWLLTADRFHHDPAALEDGVLLLESSEELIPPREFGWILRSVGERGILGAVDAVVVARPPTSNFAHIPATAERAHRRAAQRETAIDVIGRLQPRRGDRGRSSLRPHPSPMDPALRGRDDDRCRQPQGPGLVRLTTTAVHVDRSAGRVPVT